jgi:hypothetical protein
MFKFISLPDRFRLCLIKFILRAPIRLHTPCPPFNSSNFSLFFSKSRLVTKTSKHIAISVSPYKSTAYQEHKQTCELVAKRSRCVPEDRLANTKTLKTHEKQPKIAEKIAQDQIWPKIRIVDKIWPLKHSLLAWSWKLWKSQKNSWKSPKKSRWPCMHRWKDFRYQSDFSDRKSSFGLQKANFGRVVWKCTFFHCEFLLQWAMCDVVMSVQVSWMLWSSVARRCVCVCVNPTEGCVKFDRFCWSAGSQVTVTQACTPA